MRLAGIVVTVCGAIGLAIEPRRSSFHVRTLFAGAGLECHEQIVIQQRLDKIHEANEYSHHVDNLRSFAPEFAKATIVERVDAALARVIISPIYQNTIRDRWPFNTGDDPKQWGLKIAEGLLAWKPAPRHEQADKFIKNPRP